MIGRSPLLMERGAVSVSRDQKDRLDSPSFRIYLQLTGGADAPHFIELYRRSFWALFW